MEILIKIAQFLLSLSLLIVLHEFGHYIAARIFKTRVEKFYLFFDAWGKKLFSFKRGDTEYGMGWLPLGGYVKISGMIDESMDKEQMKLPPKPYEFRSKPAWQRLIIMLGGVTVNFILGILIYIMIVNVWGEYRVEPQGVKHGFTVSEIFNEYGFKEGDKITQINGEEPFDVTDINKLLFFRDVETVQVTHENGMSETISIPENIGSIMWEKGILKPFNPRIIPSVDSIFQDSPAARAGIKKGDLIVAINKTPVQYSYQINELIDSLQFNLSVLRDNEQISFDITPEYVKKRKLYHIGIGYDMESSLQTIDVNYNLKESIKRGNQLGLTTLKDFISQFKYVFTKKGAGEVGGFIAIGNIFPAEWSWPAFWSITALLSIMLGFMNLLPIPALDGGHALFVVFEMLTGRKPSDKFLEYAQIVGFILLMGLLLLANGNDIYKLIKGWL